MPNWAAELETWIAEHARFSQALEAVTTDYGNVKGQRDELLAVVEEFYNGYVVDNAGFEDDAWAREEGRSRSFAGEVVRTAVSRGWLARLRTDTASPLTGAEARGRLIGELRTRFKDAVAPAVAALLKKCPAPEPRFRGHRMADFAAMGADIVAPGTRGTARPGWSRATAGWGTPRNTRRGGGWPPTARG